MNALRTTMRRRIDALWALIDSESGTAFQALFYTLIMMGGIYNLAVDEPIQAVEAVSSPTFYITFLWVSVLGPLSAIVGRLLGGGLEYAGMWLQLGGDIAVGFVLFAYAAGIALNYWREGNFSIFLAAGCAIGVLLFVVRDIRHLYRVDGLARSRGAGS